MTFMLRDRPDGQFEIIISKPVLIGIFPDRDIATRVCALLESDDTDLPELAVSGFATAAADVAEAEATAAAEAVLAEAPRPVSRPAPPVANLPVVIDKPRPPAMLAPDPARLGEDDKARAFDRIMSGEKIAVVARDFGVTMSSLRAMWASHKSHLQKHIAEGGQQPCALCARPFTPSVSHPDSCARCSHG